MNYTVISKDGSVSTKGMDAMRQLASEKSGLRSSELTVNYEIHSGPYKDLKEVETKLANVRDATGGGRRKELEVYAVEQRNGMYNIIYWYYYAE